MIRAGRLDQSFYTSLLYDGYATGNAVVVVVLVGIIPGLRRLSLLDADFLPVLLDAAFSAVYGIVGAGIVALAVWAAGVYLFRRYGQIPVSFRLIGFANVALIPFGLRVWFAAPWIQILLVVVSAVWFFLAVRVIARSQFDLGHPEDSFVAGAGVLAWYVGSILF